MKRIIILFIYTLICIFSFGQVESIPIIEQDTFKMINAINTIIDVKEFPDSLYENIENKQKRKNIRDSLFVLKQNYEHNRVDALYALYSNPCYYSKLNTYKDSLIIGLWHDYKEKRALKETTLLLTLIDPPNEIKNSILTDLSVPSYIKAKLGNLKEEDIIINDFINKVKTQKLRVGDFNNSIWMLLYINSENTMRIFFEYFQSDITYLSPIVEDAFYFYKSEYSLFSNLIYELYLFYPEPVFDIRGNKYKQYLEKNNLNSTKENYEILKPYYNKVEEAIKIKFNRDIKIKAPLINNMIITSLK